MVEISEELSSYDLEADEMQLTTKEKWATFWDEEEKQTGFSLPGFFEVFPELKFKWPNWARRKDGSAIQCETDADCPFPQACCPHPIIPGIIIIIINVLSIIIIVTIILTVLCGICMYNLPITIAL